jgi:hypothetical protein
MNSLNTIIGNALEKSKLGEAGFDEHDIFSPPSMEEKIYYIIKITNNQRCRFARHTEISTNDQDLLPGQYQVRLDLDMRI